MAVFLINICKFNGCFKTFPSLSDLISHIEDTHIDYDPKVVEQKELAQPASLPLSYVLRFISDDARKETPPFLSNTSNVTNPTTTNTGSNNTGNAELKRKLAIKHHSYSMSSSNRSNTPTGSEMDEDEMVVTESEDSNDSWTTEEFSSEFIMRYGSRHSGGGSNGTPGNEKPFACPVPGCKKRYKNVNGIKYHSKNGHKKDGRVRKGYKCHCGKSYKTAQGLKNHALLTHNSQPESVLTTQQLANLAAGGVPDTEPVQSRCKPAANNGPLGGNTGTNNGGLIQRSNSPSQSLGSLSPSSSNMSSSTSTSGHGAASLGSNSLSSNVATASNMLQQLSNGNIVTVTNVPQQQQQQQQQAMPQQQHQSQQLQQMNISTQSATPTTTTTETSYSCSPIINSSINSSSSNNSTSSDNSSKQIATAPALITPAISAIAAKYNRPTATTAAASIKPSSAATTTTTPMQISPTFIEHKYSALAIKEKFFSSLRASRTASASVTANSSGGNLSAVASVSASVDTPHTGNGVGGVSGTGPNAGNMLRAVAVGQMCALQNEHIHQNLYKKTIN